MSLRLSVWPRGMLLRCLMFLLASVLAGGGAVWAEEADPVGDRLQQMIAPYVVDHPAAATVLEMEGIRLSLHTGLVRFYGQRAYRPAWFEQGRLTAAARQWLERLQGVAAEGLDPDDLHAATLAVGADLIRLTQSYGGVCRPDGLAVTDLLLTDAFLKYASYLQEGRLNPARYHDLAWQGESGERDAATMLRQVLRRGRVDDVLQALTAQPAAQRRLATYLAYYRRQALAGGWPVLPDGPPLRPGDSDGRVPALRRFLVLVGDLAGAGVPNGARYDARTVAALRRFQTRHGLRPDGVLGRETLAHINVPVERRIEQMFFNLERLGQSEAKPGDRYVQVDIADFSLTVMDKGRAVMRMPVVVGTSFRRTPTFSAWMTYLVFAPYWNVPPTILKEDKWPHIQADPAYLEKHHFEIVGWGKDPKRLITPSSIDWHRVTPATFPGMLRQKPGPWNPLGKVKFMFPNAHHVYLHDTPSRHLFAKQQRTFSSGCIRIAHPLALAVYLLEGQKGWDRQRIEAAMADKTPLVVKLRRPIPVRIVYRTAWVDAQGRLQFRDDVYLRDQQLRAALFGAGDASAVRPEMAPQAGPRARNDVGGTDGPVVR